MATKRKDRRNTTPPPTAAVGVSYRNVSMRPYADQDTRLAGLTISDVYFDGSSLCFNVPSFLLEGQAYAVHENKMNLLFNNVSPADPLTAISDAVFSMLTTTYPRELAKLCRLAHAPEEEQVQEASRAALHRFKQITQGGSKGT